MLELMNLVAPEHLEIAMENAYEYLPFVKHAGSIFLGHFTSEPIGDYFAGTNHVLPTSGTSRFIQHWEFMILSSVFSIHNIVRKLYKDQSGHYNLGIFRRFRLSCTCN